MNYSMAYTKQFLAAFFLLFWLPSGYSPRVELDEQVPYQGDTLLTNPNQVRETADGDILMDCDWPDDDVHDPRPRRAHRGRN